MQKSDYQFSSTFNSISAYFVLVFHRRVVASLGLEAFRSRLGLKGYRFREFECCKEMV